MHQRIIKYVLGSCRLNFLFTDEAEVSSVSLYLDVNFERKVLCGKVDLTVDKKKADVAHVVSLIA
jgi:hypothetical protein